MTTAAISMCKDEADVIDGTIRHIAAEVDVVLVADNGSTDGTREILEQLADELGIIVVDDPDPAYYQSVKMSALAERAASHLGARWILPFDADELWIAPNRIADDLAALPAYVNVAHAHLFNHFASAIDPAGDDPFRTIVWRQRQPGALPKVAFRWEPGAAIHQGNHGVTLPAGETFERCLEVRHFPYRSAAQFIRKARNGAAAYAATDLPADWGAHWRSYGEILERHGEEALADVYRTHFWHLSPIDNSMVHDPAAYRRWEP